MIGNDSSINIYALNCISPMIINSQGFCYQCPVCGTNEVCSQLSGSCVSTMNGDSRSNTMTKDSTASNTTTTNSTASNTTTTNSTASNTTNTTNINRTGA